ncbi:hypothetical protein BJ875DRAFT_233413 [Amylocarpus encephaloides]|uniref:Uncharacterized protein n=1 Tax=Amylocarpus encephaloides TaxID=45428 RepID=A0A9P7Y8V5_9HELO|nr:hypothetical protein BJ875DRAFT_233413 [Amylocarpus encephaloides]
MAGPFANTFEDEPMTPQSAGSANISYRANVNRQKTTKWTQAKAVDYGGDDWGDDDDYGYDPPAPPPPPISKPTGLRQQGQVLQTHPRSEPPTSGDKKASGQLPLLPRASNPRGRSNSFDADEERNFSGATVRQPSPSTTNSMNASSSGPATRFSQITGFPSTRNPSGPPPLSISTQQPHATGFRKTSQAISPVAETPQVDTTPEPGEHGAQADASASDTHARSEFQARRDYSPSAVPPPLSTRPSPAPHNAQERSSSATRFPARKSSLSQVTRPNLSGAGPSSEDASTPKSPAPAARSSSPSAVTRSPTTPTTGKNLPFIRPADIYKRAEEERQSMESGRPSLDSIMGPSNDRSESPARRPRRENPSSDKLGGGIRRRTSLDDGDSEPGRHLTPMLDTVRERKSEYGFDGLNVHDPGEGQKSEKVAQQSEINHLELEDARRSSTSPKLPDLNRISGFGMDMFSQSTHAGPTQPLAAQTGPADSTTTHIEGTTLHSQPSIGLRSVVHQAFDRTDDSSVPPTPTSRTGSGVRRTDSESTGTTGISPIMSRVPSAAAPDSRNRDVSKASILEVVNEPASPVLPDGNAQEELSSSHNPLAQPQPTIPGFKPGHRRDISTPSPGNSPARTPDLGTSATYSHGHEAFITDSDHLAESGQGLSRPLAEREQSSRPVIPGEWTSYATSSRSKTTQQDRGIEEARKPDLGQLSMSHRTDDDDLDTTPTTAKQPLPPSASTAALAPSTMETSTGGAFGEHDEGNLQSTQQPIVALPTPDPAMASSSNVYSKYPLDPRLLPKLEQAPAETQLRPDTVHQATPALSSIGPTPPPKDTPLDREAVNDVGYFPSPRSAPEQKMADPNENEALGSSDSPQMTPAVDVDPESQNNEDDQLRTEIVKKLGPHPSASSRYDDSLPTPLDETIIGGQTRESTYLPSEYDNYWASTGDNDSTIPAIVRTPSNEAVPTPAPSTLYSSLESDTTPIPPLNPRRTAPSNDGPGLPSLQQRFSWEKSIENVPKTLTSGTTANLPAPHISGTSTGTSEAPEVVPQQETGSLSHPNAPYDGLILDDRPTEQSGSPHQTNRSSIGREAALLAGGAALTAGALATRAPSTAQTETQPSRRLSLAEEKGSQVSSYLVSATPLEDNHPSRSPQPYFQSTDQTVHASPGASFPTSTSTRPPLQHATNDRILAFKEIAAMKSQQQRIATFDATRERYAQMDSGLNAWMVTLQAQQPEHADQTGLWGGSARSKFAKSAGSGTTPLQQPYYQQYLNASSPTTPTSTSNPGSNMPVQAKGKELLHTAGIFGGKAGKAGKGLLAKGKSRLRGSGGGDKVE